MERNRDRLGCHLLQKKLCRHCAQPLEHQLEDTYLNAFRQTLETRWDFISQRQVLYSGDTLGALWYHLVS